jgi:hypothetical protein
MLSLYSARPGWSAAMLRHGLVAALLVAPAIARADPAADTAAAVRAADEAFEARAQAVGAAQAFREYMDPDRPPRRAADGPLRDRLAQGRRRPLEGPDRHRQPRPTAGGAQGWGLGRMPLGLLRLAAEGRVVQDASRPKDRELVPCRRNSGSKDRVATSP